MIDVQPKIHDKFTLELKIGFHSLQQEPVSNFEVNIWSCLPDSLDINPSKYTKTDFYRDIKTNLRLITPPFSLEQIANDENNVPLKELTNSIAQLQRDNTNKNIAQFHHNVKMYAAIAKSAFRDGLNELLKGQPDAEDLRQYVRNAINVLSNFRNVHNSIKEMPDDITTSFSLCDEFLSNIYEQYVFKAYNTDTIKSRPDIREWMRWTLENELEYKKRNGFLHVEKNPTDNNAEFVSRAGQLKKYVEGELYLKSNKLSNTFLTEQFFFGIAAILAMLASTLLTYHFSDELSNFTLPVLIAIVLIYALKDRIKDWVKYFYSNHLKKYLFDSRTWLQQKGEPLGLLKEGFLFVRNSKAYQEIGHLLKRDTLTQNVANRNEKIMLYRQHIRLFKSRWTRNSHYPFVGINEIIGYNISSWVRKMDNPDMPLSVFDEGNGNTTVGEKNYRIDFVIECSFEGQTEYKPFTLFCNHDGIRKIEGC